MKVDSTALWSVGHIPLGNMNEFRLSSSFLWPKNTDYRILSYSFKLTRKAYHSNSKCLSPQLEKVITPTRKYINTTRKAYQYNSKSLSIQLEKLINTTRKAYQYNSKSLSIQLGKLVKVTRKHFKLTRKASQSNSKTLYSNSNS